MLNYNPLKLNVKRMYMKSIEVFTGNSELGIDEAMQNALDNAGNPSHYVVLETQGSRDHKDYCHYQVVLKKSKAIPETAE